MNPPSRLRNGYVATAIEPLALGEAGRSGQTLGSCYEVLQAQAAAEGAFFEEAGLQDLAAEGRATCNELVRRVNSLFRAYIAGTWAPVTVFKLNQERQQLRFLSASLGLPEAAEGMRAEELQEVRKLAVAASEGALAQGLPAVLQAFGGMLSALRAQLAGLVPAEQTILPEDMEERWFGLADRVMAVCARACEEQESFWEREVSPFLTEPSRPSGFPRRRPRASPVRRI